MTADYGALMEGHPAPFVKRGTLSARFRGPPDKLYLDAINNQGFSGGPLYFGTADHPRIAGVVSKFYTQQEHVLDEDGKPTGHTVPYNTGFLVAYCIADALDLVNV